MPHPWQRIRHRACLPMCPRCRRIASQTSLSCRHKHRHPNRRKNCLPPCRRRQNRSDRKCQFVSPAKAFAGRAAYCESNQRLLSTPYSPTKIAPRGAVFIGGERGIVSASPQGDPAIPHIRSGPPRFARRPARHAPRVVGRTGGFFLLPAHQQKWPLAGPFLLAEREGFEPSIGFCPIRP